MVSSGETSRNNANVNDILLFRRSFIVPVVTWLCMENPPQKNRLSFKSLCENDK